LITFIFFLMDPRAFYDVDQELKCPTYGSVIMAYYRPKSPCCDCFFPITYSSPSCGMKTWGPQVLQSLNYTYMPNVICPRCQCCSKESTTPNIVCDVHSEKKLFKKELLYRSPLSMKAIECLLKPHPNTLISVIELLNFKRSFK